MKHERIALLVMLMLLASNLCCAEPAVVDPAADVKAAKTNNGLKDVLLGWLEIPSAITRVSRESNNPLWGLTAGTLQGIAAAFPKTVGGAAEISSPRTTPPPSATGTGKE